MSPNPRSLANDVEVLGVLAMRFRGTRRDADRRDVASEYAQTVERLIRGGRWREMPPPEDQLPDDWMPRAYFDYWLPRSVP